MINCTIKPIFKIFVAVILLSTLSTSACSRYTENSDNKFSTGHKLSKSEISRLQEEKSDTTLFDSPMIEITDQTVYYWTATGSKLHLFSDCQSFAKADPTKIKSGSLEDAYNENKSNPCSFCLKHAGITEDDFPKYSATAESTTKNPEPDTTVTITLDENFVYIWTKSGTKLHIFEDCSHLSKTLENNKIRGTFEEAKENGIDEICSKCKSNAQISD